MSHFLASLASSCCALGLLAVDAAADRIWNATVPAGQVVPANVRVTAVWAGMKSTDQDMHSLPFAGSISARLSPTVAPFQSIEIYALELTTRDGYYQFDFFCDGILGCQHVDTNNSLAVHTLIEPVRAQLAGLTFTFTALFRVHFVTASTGVVSESHDGTTDIPITFSGTIAPGPNGATLESMSLSEYYFPVPPSAMPVGMTATSYVRSLPTEANFMVGPWSTVSPADINADGAVNGLDLGVLLGAWGTAALAADINNDGIVDGLDLGEIMASWT